MKDQRKQGEGKMKLFKVEMQRNAELTFEQRINEVRAMGKKSAEEFEVKFESLNKLFGEYDALYLLSFCNKYFVISEEGYDEEAENGFLEFPAYYVEILQAMALRHPQNYSRKPLIHEVENFKTTMQGMARAAKIKWLNLPEDYTTEAQIYQHGVRTEMMVHTAAVRNWAYYHQMQRVSYDFADRIKDDFRRLHGVCPVELLRLFDRMTEIVNDRYNEHEQKLHEILRQEDFNEMMDAYEKHFDAVVSTSHEERKRLWQKLEEDILELRVMFMAHSDLFLPDLFSFTADEMMGMCVMSCDKSKLLSLFEKISYAFGDLKDFEQDHIILSNPVHARPFIRLENESYFTSMWWLLQHVSLNLLESLAGEDDELRKRCGQHKGKYLEEEIQRLADKAFPDATIYHGSKWTGLDGKEYETDAIVVMPPFMVIIEAKSGQIPAAAKRGAPERLAKTIKELIEEPSDQALRLISVCKKSNKSIKLQTANKGKVIFNTADIKYYIPLGVTLSHFGVVSTNLKSLIDGGFTQRTIDQLAPSMSLTDLEIVWDLLPSTAHKLHYLQRRREFELNVEYSADEIDLLAFYLDTGFNIGATEFSKEYYFNLILKSKDLDPYIIGSAQGEAIAKPEPNLTTWWKDMIQRLETVKPPNWLETSYVLLNFSKDQQEQMESGLRELVAKRLSEKMEYKHNWIVGSTENEQRKFIVVAYPYHDQYRDERNAMMGDMIEDLFNDNVKGLVVIAINIEKGHYPYSVMATTLQPLLFESTYTEMVNISPVVNPST